MGKTIVSSLIVGAYTIVDILMFYTLTEWWLHLDPVFAAVIVLGTSINGVRNKVEGLTR